MSVGIDLTPLGVERVRVAPRKKLGRGTFDDYLRAYLASRRQSS